MDQKIIDALKAVTDALVKTVQQVLPGYPEEQMLVGPKLSVADVRLLIKNAETKHCLSGDCTINPDKFGYCGCRCQPCMYRKEIEGEWMANELKSQREDQPA